LFRVAIEEVRKKLKHESHRPVVIRGAKGTGKTWLMEYIAEKYYDDYIYVSFDYSMQNSMQNLMDADMFAESASDSNVVLAHAKDQFIGKMLENIFETASDPQVVIDALLNRYAIKPKNSLIIFDEIQDCPEALVALGYLGANNPNIDIIAASSFAEAPPSRRARLEDAMKKWDEMITEPASLVAVMDLYPLTFDEFIHALGDDELYELFQQKKTEILNAHKDQFEDYYYKYLTIGGMPECVLAYVESQIVDTANQTVNNESRTTYAESQAANSAPDIVISSQPPLASDTKQNLSPHRNDVNSSNKLEHIRDKNVIDTILSIQKRILTQYEIEAKLRSEKKYTKKIDAILSSLPEQTGQKFMVGRIDSKARIREYQPAIDWLSGAYFTYKINRVTEAKSPLKSYEDPKAYKLFLPDVGLLSCLLLEDGAHPTLDFIKTLYKMDSWQETYLKLAQQFVVQQVISKSKLRPAYWLSKTGKATIDVLVDIGTEVVPIDINPTGNTKSKKLDVYIQKNNPRLAMKAYNQDAKLEAGLVELPIFGVGILS
jgi:predicted AAA+ superfamily ATPase